PVEGICRVRVVLQPAGTADVPEEAPDPAAAVLDYHRPAAAERGQQGVAVPADAQYPLAVVESLRRVFRVHPAAGLGVGDSLHASFQAGGLFRLPRPAAGGKVEPEEGERGDNEKGYGDAACEGAALQPVIRRKPRVGIAAYARLPPNE